MYLFRILPLLFVFAFECLAATPDWTWRNPLPQGNDLLDVAWGGGQFVAIGANGTIIVSTDGKSWWPRASNTRADLRTICWGNGKFVVAGKGGALLTSTNGHVWVNHPGTAPTEIADIIWAADKFVAVGGLGGVMTSPDGIVWTLRNSLTTLDLRAVAWSGTSFVAIGGGTRSNGTVITSPDATFWTVVLADSAAMNSYRALTYVDGCFVAVGNGGRGSRSFDDGASWTSPREFFHIPYYDLYAIVASGTSFTTVGNIGVAWHVPRGSSGEWFHLGSQATTCRLRGVTHGDSTYVAVGEAGTIQTSSDGIDWTISSYTERDASFTVSYAGGKFFALSGDSFVLPGGRIYTSADAVLWEPQPTGGSYYFTRVIWDGRQYVAVGGDTTILTSADAKVWVVRNPRGNGIITDVAWNGQRFVTARARYTSEDGLTWTWRGYGPYADRIIWADTRFVAVGDGNSVEPFDGIDISPDGLTWTSHSIVSGPGLRSVTWNGSLLVAVGNKGRILTSTNATSWIVQVSPTSEDIYDVTWTGDQFIATGDMGVTLVSSDGFAWTEVTPVTTHALTSVASGNGMIVAAGNGSTILSAGKGPGRLSNMSVRSRTGAGDKTLIVGFVLGGAGEQPVLVRALGPTLRDFEVRGALEDTGLRLYRGPVLQLENDDWGGTPDLLAAFERLGAYPLPLDSKDSALLPSLHPGVYTAHVTSDSDGVALVEAYDGGDGTPRLLNISARSEVGDGDDVLIVGFVVAGPGTKTLLIRGVGKGVEALGVNRTLQSHRLVLFDSFKQVIDSNESWGEDPRLRHIFTRTGAFDLAREDTALLVSLPPGSYTAHVAGGSGVALVEVYVVD